VHKGTSNVSPCLPDAKQTPAAPFDRSMRRAVRPGRPPISGAGFHRATYAPRVIVDRSRPRTSRVTRHCVAARADRHDEAGGCQRSKPA
jgi:hypothetical protein